MASAAPDPDPQPPARPALFVLPSDLEAVELLRLWTEGGAAAVPSWIHPAEVYGHSPSDLIVAHQPASAADGSEAWFLVTTVRHLGPKDQRIRRVVTGGGTWKGEHSHPLVSLPDHANVGSVRSLTYKVKADDGKETRSGHLMREYRLPDDAGLVTGSNGLEAVLCVIYVSPRDAKVAAAKAIEKAAAKASRDAAKAAKAEVKAADQARRAEQKAKRASAQARWRARWRASKPQELAAANAAAGAAVLADTHPQLAWVGAAGNPGACSGGAAGNPGAYGGGAAGNPGAYGGGVAGNPGACSGGVAGNPGACSGGAAGNPGACSGGAAGNPGAYGGGAAGNPGACGGGVAGNPGACSGGAAGNPGACGGGAAGNPGAYGGGDAGNPGAHSSSPLTSASSKTKRRLLLEVGAASFPMPDSCLSWKKVYEAQQVEDEPPYKKVKRLDCSGWFLLDARHTEKLEGDHCATA